MNHKKTWQKLLQISTLLILVLFLTACSSSQEPLGPNSTGFWDQYILLNLSRFIIGLSHILGGNYGIGIILFTIIVRIILLPLNKIQMDSQRQMQELQPELDAIKAKYPNQDRESMEKLQEEQLQLMEDRGINQWTSLLPLLIQLPVMMALYQSIIRTEALRQGSFLWVNLGQPDPFFILPIIAAILTLVNTYLTMKSNPSQNSAMKWTMYFMPLMILFISVGLPSAITLYLVVSNAFTVIQTLVFNNPYKIIAEREAKEVAEKAKQRELRRQLRRATGKKKR
ncbi:hypothetical protein CL176_00035 [Suicoccus acidiformans]|uniref:Membrane protein insertase YidC n=1 Tax=Suicoccus acidiformans TaxID=2036206 RepID=A0A347WHI5_9LACT|nr:YidC/Oxa1 family membrane protein insertase [Suicoccus acidiformans]AXY24542.1 hypothetical protein CL176_00035 [Suicoccus acidiformans]